MPPKRFLGEALYELFHENTKQFTLPDDGGSHPQEDDWKEITYKTFDRAPTITVESDEYQINGNLREVIANRRSTREFIPSRISIEEMGILLRTAAGITERGESKDRHRRAYPSAGASYPLEVYGIVLDSTDLDSRVIHYNALDDCIELLHKFEDTPAFVTEYGVEQASLLLVLTAKMNRIVDKYSDRGYRYTLFGAGHLMQNVCLVTESMGLQCRPWGGFVEDSLASSLPLDTDEITIYVGVIGTPADDTTSHSPDDTTGASN